MRPGFQALSLALLLSTAIAQRPSSWVPLTLLAPIVSANISSLGKTHAYLDVGGKLSFFSAFAREWRQVTAINANPPIRVFNDLAFVEDTNQIIAFSAYRCAIEILPVSAGAIVVNPLTQRNDSILTVVDGSTLWTFVSFQGKWTSRTLTTASPILATQRHVLLLAEGANLYGMSAFDGTWVPLTANGPATSAYGDGSWGVVETATTLYGFSAQRNSWSVAQKLGAGVQSKRSEDCVVYWDNQKALAYTGLRGGFASTAITPPVTVGTDALVGAVQNSTSIQLYSAVLNHWSSTTTTTTAAITVRPHLVTWNDGGVVSAFSPFLGSVATLPIAAVLDSANQGVAAAIDLVSSKLYMYSTLTGAWATAPQGSMLAIPDMIWCGALIQNATGYYAFSGRTGRFIPLATSGPAVKWADSNSSVIAVEENAKLSIFEPRREVWLSVNKVNALPLTVRIWRTTLLAVDGSTVHGFGTFAGTIESYTLPAAPTEINANSECLRAGVGTTLACFGGTPDMVTLYQFPEFRRVYTAGSFLETQLHGAAGSLVWTLFGTLAAAPVNLPPYGDLFIDGSNLSVLSLGVLPADGRVSLKFFVPDAPVLRGLEPCFQGLVQPTSGTPYLTRMASVTLH